MLEKYLIWIKAHERLIFALLLAALGWYGWHSYMGYREHELEVNATLKQKELQEALDASKVAAGVVATKTNQVATLDANALRIINGLQSKIAELDKALAARQKSDAALTDTELANRWASLTGLGPSDLLPQPSGGLTATHTAAIVTVQKLEEVPALEDKVVNLQGITDQQAGQIAAKNDLITSMKDEADKLKVALAKAEPACDSRVQLAVQQQKDKDSKGNWVWRGVTFVAGVLLGRRL